MKGTQMKRPNILFIMTDQQRFDTITALGNSLIYTPNMDRLVRRGVSFTSAYSTCPVCVAARYTIRTGCEPKTTLYFSNSDPNAVPDSAPSVEDRTGPYLPRTLSRLGYRTFGIGKFHTTPCYEDLGYEIHFHAEEMFGHGERRLQDSYAAWIAKEHPEYNYIEMLHGERTEMYYMPQMSPMPAECTVEAYEADRAIEQLQQKDDRPYFGFVSFIGPHPPFAPPIPYNRLYDPDRMPNPVRGNIEIDHMDEILPWMNHFIWAEDINDSHARVLRSRYYGEITYIDHCLGRILDTVEAQDNADNTLICFFSDHGDHFGDHHSWQKESFFDSACRVPFLISWPKRISQNIKNDTLVCLTDLFGIATYAAGATETRDGIDVLGVLDGTANPREYLFGYYGWPGTPQFKMMVKDDSWKYIFMANGGRKQLFNCKEDPNEIIQRTDDAPEAANRLHSQIINALSHPNLQAALEDGDCKAFPFEPMERKRVYQYNRSYGEKGFPERPEELLKIYRDEIH
jgi:arylsulfatase